MRKKAAIFLLLLILLCIPAAAHSGGTDENGGHIDHSTGEYHYHHGYPAHQHDGGVCRIILLISLAAPAGAVEAVKAAEVL